MKEEEKNPQQTTEGQTSSQPTDDQTSAKVAEGTSSQAGADKQPQMEDERTGEGTGARAGEYS